MKMIAFAIIASTLTGCLGYWAASDGDESSSTPAAKASRPARQARRSAGPAESQAILASGAQSAEPAAAVDPVKAEPATLPSTTRAAADETAEADSLFPLHPLSIDPIEGFEIASVDDDIRFVPTTRPSVPLAQHPPLSNEQNVDTGKPVHEWQRLTDDWFGARPWLDDRGVAFQASLTTDWSKVFRGGVDTEGSAFRDLFNLTLTLDTERLFNWKGGTLFVNFQNQAGDDGGADVGNLQGISNIDADGRTQVSELWYEQVLFDGKLRLKAGKVDANADFAHTPFADEYINGAFGAAPTILGFPTYPDPATSLNVFVNPTENVFAGFGVYDGSTQAGHNTGSSGPATFFSNGGLFYIAEGGVKWTTGRGLDGVLSAGIWHHTGDFERFDGGTDAGATGEYVILNHQLWLENPDDKDDEQGVGMFLKYGHTDGDVSAIEHHVAAGVVCTGLLPKRDDDVLGLGVCYARLSEQGGFEHNNETVYELFYRARLNAWLSVKPDLQYIHNAADGVRRDTLVGMVRVIVDF